MKSLIRLRSVLIGLLLAAVPLTTQAALDTNRIAQITGLPGAWNAAEAVFKVTAPRNDLPVTVDGWKMPPFMGLTTWAAFIEGKKAEAMVAGDFVLFEDEVNPVMSVALDAGLSVTALHNHFFFDEPKVYFMHIGGEGTVEKLAGAVKKVYDTIKAIRGPNPKPSNTFGQATAEKGQLPSTSSITAAPLNEVFAMQGET